MNICILIPLQSGLVFSLFQPNDQQGLLKSSHAAKNKTYSKNRPLAKKSVLRGRGGGRDTISLRRGTFVLYIVKFLYICWWHKLGWGYISLYRGHASLHLYLGLVLSKNAFLPKIQIKWQILCSDLFYKCLPLTCFQWLVETLMDDVDALLFSKRNTYKSDNSS